MTRKHIPRLAIVGGSHAGVAAKRPVGSGFATAGLFTRLMRALRGQRPASRGLHAVELPATAAEPAPLYEQHFANEGEARAFANDLVARGTRAEVVHDLYDFSWSVEVYGPDQAPRHDA